MTLGGDSLSNYCTPFSPSALLSLPSASPSSSSACSSSSGSVRMSRKFRSTKGASKARRDLINGEIRKLRALLPIGAEERERLSYLHAMSIICTFIRKSALLQTNVASSTDGGLVPPSADLLNALPGFIVAMTKDGKLLYVSENVSQYLGLSMVDVLQGDTFYSMIHNNDKDRVRFQLENNDLNAGQSSVCTFRCNRQWRPLLVKTRTFEPHHHLVVALCSPTPRESESFVTTHSLDMRYTGTTHSMVLHLGYEAEELIGRSWYSLIHPDDLLLSTRTHTQLIHCEQVETVLRVQNNQMNWVWLYIMANKESQSQKITCTNYIISEVEALYLREKLCSTMSTSSSPSPAPSVSPPLSQTGQRSPKRPADGSNGGDGRRRRKIRRMCKTTPDNNVPASSPPYSPTSSLSPPLQEVSHSHFLFPSQSYSPASSATSQTFTYQSFSPASVSSDSSHMSSDLMPLPLSAEPVPLTSVSSPLSPPLFCYPSDGAYVPDIHAELPVGSTDSFLHLQDFALLPSAQTGSESAFAVPENYAPSDLLTPPPLSVQCYSETEQEVISVLAQQISTLASSFDSYRAKRYTPCPENAACFHSHDPEAFLLDEGIIENVLQVPQAPLEVQALETLLDIEMCSSSDHQSDLSLYVHTDFLQDGFPDDSMYSRNNTRL